MSVIVALVCTLPAAVAADGVARKEPLAALEVERGLVLPRGWIEVAASFERKVATGEWSADGDRREWPEGTRWTYTTEAVALRAGIAPRLELHAEVPVHQARLEVGSEVSTAVGLGDAAVGARAEWVRRRPPTRSVATDLTVKLPTGPTPSDAVVGAGPRSGAIALGTGQADLSVALIGLQQLGPFALTAEAAYTRRFASSPAYTLAEEEPGAWVRPGDTFAGGLGALLQAGPLALSTRARASRWLDVSVGPGGGDGASSRSSTPVEGTAGWALELDPAVMIDASRGVQLGGAVHVPVAGAGAAMFPLEGLTPTRGAAVMMWVALRG